MPHRLSADGATGRVEGWIEARRLERGRDSRLFLDLSEGRGRRRRVFRLRSLRRPGEANPGAAGDDFVVEGWLAVEEVRAEAAQVIAAQWAFAPGDDRLLHPRRRLHRRPSDAGLLRRRLRWPPRLLRSPVQRRGAPRPGPALRHPPALRRPGRLGGLRRRRARRVWPPGATTGPSSTAASSTTCRAPTARRCTGGCCASTRPAASATRRAGRPGTPADRSPARAAPSTAATPTTPRVTTRRAAPTAASCATTPPGPSVTPGAGRCTTPAPRTG